MFITTRNNYTKITKDIYMMKVLSSTEDTMYSLDIIPYTINIEFTLLPEGHPLVFHFYASNSK